MDGPAKWPPHWANRTRAISGGDAEESDADGIDGIAQALPITSFESRARFVPLGRLAHGAIPTSFHIRRCEGGGP